ncbi:zonular occludens toxin domain-containing protein [Pseudorhodoferax sp.]|uniref:zonular occludens toxin domain-containing protein n=1 Tax=Pseudorhodoferax sp. TaxID=1993553 RepID=UPI0039E3059E
MITVITGQPGAGKTALCVERFLMTLAAKGYEEKAIDPDGNEVTVRRRILTNVNGLLLDHEKIDDALLATWHEWVKPGDLIVFDEVQKPWPYTVMNKAQDKCITELETHRHYGIDFILMTQHPMLCNSAVHRLAGQHLHVRKLGNSRFATVYEWDGVSRTLSYKAAFAKKPWRRGKEVEKTYKSSSLHTRQRRAVPTVLFGVLFAALLLGVLGPKVYGRLSDRISGQTVAVGAPSTAAAKAPALAASAPQIKPALAPASPLPVLEPQLASAPALVAASGTAVFAGCARMRDRCTCFDGAGVKVEREPEFCADHALAHVPAKVAEPPASLDRFLPLTYPQRSPADAALIAWADREREKRHRAIGLPIE